MSGVGAVGLRTPHGPAGGRGVGRLRQMRLDPGTLQLLHDEPPAGAGLDRERRRRSIDVRLEPATQQHPVRRGDATPPGLAAALIQIVEGDLPPVNVQSAYDPHRGPPQAPTADALNSAPELRGSLRMSSFPRWRGWRTGRRGRAWPG